MSAEIVNTEDDLLTIRISGKLTQPELRGIQQQAAIFSPSKILEVGDDTGTPVSNDYTRDSARFSGKLGSLFRLIEIPETYE